MGIKEEYAKFLERIRATPVERQLTTSEEVRDPKIIEWCLLKLQAGAHLLEVRALVGLRENEYLWGKLRARLIEFDAPRDENSAFAEFLLRQEQIVASIQSQIQDVEELILAGPKPKVIKGSGRQGDTVLEDRVYPQLHKLKKELTDQLAHENQRTFSNFVDKKKLRQGVGKYSGAKITIISNVPRPQLKEVEETIRSASEVLDE